MKKNLLSLSFALGFFVAFGQNEKSIGSINNGMPNRLSMNVTVAKQTQGATFGEKINAGLCQAGTYIIFPNKQAFLITDNEISEMTSPEIEKVNVELNAAERSIAQGTSLPGGAIIYAAVSKKGENNKLWQIRNVGNNFKMPSTFPNGEYELVLDLLSHSKSISSLKVSLVFFVDSGTYKITSLKTKHETAKNSISNMR
jgi:hypothetical protein